MLRSLPETAFFQPGRALEIARYALENPVEPTDDIGLFKTTQRDVLHSLPAILRNVAFHGGHVGDAVRLLWELTKQDDRETNPHPDHPLRVLRELASYGRYKSVTFNSRIADAIADILKDPEAFRNRFTPLDVVDELLDKEGEFHESHGVSISLGSFPLAYDRVGEVRRKALAMIENALGMENPRACSRAVQSLARVISGFSPAFGRSPSDEELRWQDEERISALDIIERRIGRFPFPVPLARELKVILWRFSRRTRKDEIDARVENLLREIGNSPDLFIYDTFCTSQWDYDVISRDINDSDRRFADQLESATDHLRALFPRPSDQIAALERMFAEAAAFDVNAFSSGVSLVDSLCHDSEFRAAYSAYLRGKPVSGLAFQIRALLPNLRHVAVDEYLNVGTMGATGGRELALGVSNAICYGEPLQKPTDADLSLLALLCQHNEADVRRDALHGVARLAESAQYRPLAIMLALETDIGTDGALGDAFAGIFHPSHLNPSELTEEQVGGVLDKLVRIGDLDRNGQSFHLSEFLDWACANHPELAFEFIIARLDHEATLEMGRPYQETYRSVPDHDVSPQFRGFARSHRYAALLSGVRDRMIGKKYPAYRLSGLFWSIGELNAETFGVIDEWVHSGDDSKVRAALRLLRDAPKNVAIAFPYFAVHIVDCAGQVSPELGQDAMSVFIGHARTRDWQATVKEPPEEMVKLRDAARALAENLKGSSTAERLFGTMTLAVDRQIQEWKAEGRRADG